MNTSEPNAAWRQRKKCAAAGQPRSTLLLGARQATQRSVKFVRWLRQSLRDHTAEAIAVLRLKTPKPRYSPTSSTPFFGAHEKPSFCGANTETLFRKGLKRMLSGEKCKTLAS